MADWFWVRVTVAVVADPAGEVLPMNTRSLVPGTVPPVQMAGVFQLPDVTAPKSALAGAVASSSRASGTHNEWAGGMGRMIKFRVWSQRIGLGRADVYALPGDAQLPVNRSTTPRTLPFEKVPRRVPRMMLPSASRASASREPRAERNAQVGVHVEPGHPAGAEGGVEQPAGRVVAGSQALDGKFRGRSNGHQLLQRGLPDPGARHGPAVAEVATTEAVTVRV